MRSVKTLLMVIGAVTVLVLASNTVAIAATGHALILGKKNTASKLTKLNRTTAGPALKLGTTSSSAAPLKVNGRGKVANLNADKIDGLDSTQLRTRSSAFQAPGCKKLDTATSTWAKIADLGTFTKKASSTDVNVQFSTSLRAASIAGTGVVFELRIDGASTQHGRAATLIRSQGVHHPASMFGIFPGISAGSHTVSIWARSAGIGDATDAGYDAGCFNSAGVNHVFVQEAG